MNTEKYLDIYIYIYYQELYFLMCYQELYTLERNFFLRLRIFHRKLVLTRL